MSENICKTTFLFTGQGAQYAGMGKDLYEKYNAFKQIFDEASEHLKINLIDICGDIQELSKTNNAQSAIFAVSYGIYKLLADEYNIKPDFIAGFSLGEMTSLCVSEILTFKDTLDLIKVRGGVMQAACEYKPGLMYSVIGAADDAVEEVCTGVLSSGGGYVIPANYNCPGQVVISGETEAVETAVRIFSEKKIRAMKLNVAGAFHSSLMQYKQDELIKFLGTLNFNAPKIDLYSNLTGEKFIFDRNIKSFMIDYIPKQMSNPVKFRKELENLESDGCGLFIEIGAGKVLSGLVKRTCKNARITNIQDADTLESAIELFNIK
ncbi:MAG: ACP S-malonyltransferase [Oscillospiraceae bacterium]|nr:ACP S-malonyltransferase [Oscillospiraceae bacterium]